MLRPAELVSCGILSFLTTMQFEKEGTCSRCYYFSLDPRIKHSLDLCSRTKEYNKSVNCQVLNKDDKTKASN